MTVIALRLHSMSKMSRPEAEPSVVLTGVKKLTLVKRTEDSWERNSAQFKSQFNFKLHDCVAVSTDSTGKPISTKISNRDTLQISKKQN